MTPVASYNTAMQGNIYATDNAATYDTVIYGNIYATENAATFNAENVRIAVPKYWNINRTFTVVQEDGSTNRLHLHPELSRVLQQMLQIEGLKRIDIGATELSERGLTITHIYFEAGIERLEAESTE